MAHIDTARQAMPEGGDGQESGPAALIDLEIMGEGGAPVRLSVPAPALVGRAAHCGVRLKGWRVAREHARLLHQADGVFVEDLGSLAGTAVDEQRVVRFGPLLPQHDIGIGPAVLRVLGSRVPETPAPLPPVGAPAGVAPVELPAATDRALETAWRQRLHARLLAALDLRRRDVAAMGDAALREEADRIVADLLVREEAMLPPVLDRARLRRQVVDEAVGLGPLEALLADPAISEIMVNRHDELYVEERGRLRRHDSCFVSEQAVLGVIERIVAPIGRRIDESSPMVDARLADGSRVNAVIGPLALRGASLTIRKFPARRLAVDDLVASQALDGAMAEFLRYCVEQRLNIVVAGGTGAGKTTLLNVLSGFIPPGERIITIEDAAELRLAHGHLVALEARPPNLEGRGAVTIRDLVRNALRMRPDRIVVGECRGAEALDMLQAMNTGHEGSLTTLHANTPRDALARLETMVLMAGMALPLGAVREQIASAVDIIVQQARLPCGARRVTAIVEVCGIESGCIQMQELFRFERTGGVAAGGRFVGCDAPPTFLDAWRQAGVAVAPALFRSQTPCGVEGRA